jgi:hypothetical protein
MAEKRCVYKCGAWNCGSYQFNLYKDDIDQGELCDVHYWQTKAQRQWVGLTDDEITEIYEMGLGVRASIETALDKLEERNT